MAQFLKLLRVPALHLLDILRHGVDGLVVRVEVREDRQIHVAQAVLEYGHL